MREERIKYFQSLTLEEKEKLRTKDFTVSKLKELIDGTPMSSFYKKMATYRFIKSMTYEKISEKLGCSVRTVKLNLPKITTKLVETCYKMFQ